MIQGRAGEGSDQVGDRTGGRGAGQGDRGRAVGGAGAGQDRGAVTIQVAETGQTVLGAHLMHFLLVEVNSLPFTEVKARTWIPYYHTVDLSRPLWICRNDRKLPRLFKGGGGWKG